MLRILIIDDAADLRSLVEQILTGAGHKVLTAVDGREGVEQHSACAADLVITDLQMPGQNGVETIREFRRRWPQVPIIAMTGSITESGNMLSIVQNLAGIGVLQKPFTEKELIGAVTRAIATRVPARLLAAVQANRTNVQPKAKV